LQGAKPNIPDSLFDRRFAACITDAIGDSKSARSINGLENIGNSHHKCDPAAI
jgi:hypothetical protein